MVERISVAKEWDNIFPQVNQEVPNVRGLKTLLTARDFEGINHENFYSVLHSAEGREVVKEALSHAYQDMDMEHIAAIVQQCDVSHEEHLDASTDALVRALRTDPSFGSHMLLWLKEYPALFRAPVLDAAQDALVQMLCAGRVAVATSIFEALESAAQARRGDYAAHLLVQKKLQDFIHSSAGKDALEEGLRKGMLAGDLVDTLKKHMGRESIYKVKKQIAAIRLQEGLEAGREGFLHAVKQMETEGVSSLEIQGIVKEVIVQDIRHGKLEQSRDYVHSAQEFLPKNFLQSPEIFSAAKEGIAVQLEQGDIEIAANFIRWLSLHERYYSIVVETAVVRALAAGNYKNALAILDSIPLRRHQMFEMTEDALPAVFNVLESASYRKVCEFARMVKIPSATLEQPAVQRAAEKMIERTLPEMKSVDEIIKVIRQYSIQKAPFEGAARTQLVELAAKHISLHSDPWKDVVFISDFFSLSIQDMQEIARAGLREVIVPDESAHVLSSQDIDPQKVQGIHEHFSLPEQEASAIIVQAVSTLLLKGRVKRAVQCIDVFGVDPVVASEHLTISGWDTVLRAAFHDPDRKLLTKFLDIFSPPAYIVHDPVIRSLILEKTERKICGGDDRDVAMLIHRFALTDEEMKRAGYGAFSAMLKWGKNPQELSRVLRRFHLSKEGAIEILGENHPALFFFNDGVPFQIRCASESYFDIDPSYVDMLPLEKVAWRLRTQNVWWAIQAIKEEKISPEEVSAFLRDNKEEQQIVDAYEEGLVEQLRFAELDELLVYMGREIPIISEYSTRVLQEYIREKMPKVAEECLMVMDKHGVAMTDHGLRKEISRMAAEETERRRLRPFYEVSQERDLPRQAHLLASLFYCDVRVMQNANIVLENIAKHDIDLPFAARLRLHEIRNDMRADIDAISSRLRQYLCAAVSSEMKHQCCLRNSSALDVTFPESCFEGVEKFFHYGTTEEKIVYFTQAKARFLQDGWDSSTGGKKWADIAEGAKRLCQEPNDVALIDHIFDLEHNTRAIFDKESDLIEQNEDAMIALKTDRVLDIKRDVRGGTRALIAALHEALPQDTEFFERLHLLVDRWIDILRAIERSYTARGRQFVVERYI
jgi:hypothetical protein